MGKIVILIFVIDSISKLYKHFKQKNENEINAFESKRGTKALKEQKEQKEKRQQQEVTLQEEDKPHPLQDLLSDLSALTEGVVREFNPEKEISDNWIRDLFVTESQDSKELVSLEDEQIGLKKSQISTEEYRKSYDFVRSKDAATKERIASSYRKENRKKDTLFQTEKDSKVQDLEQLSLESIAQPMKKTNVISVEKRKDTRESVRLKRSDLKRAILWKEILDKPVSLRR